MHAKPMVFNDTNYDMEEVDHRYLLFPGGEIHYEVDEALSGTVVIVAHVTSALDFMSIFVLQDALEGAGADKIVLYIPYFPGARQDRAKGGIPLTVRVYADMVNNAGFNQVIVVDPHSDVTPALLNNVTVVPQDDVFAMMRTDIPSEHLKGPKIFTPEEAVLVAPDAGAVKKTEQIAIRFGYDVVYGRKHRDMKTGKLSRFSCDPIPSGKKVIVVDDICDGGGTFLGLANQIVREPERFEERNGFDQIVLNYESNPWADLQLVVTHGIFSNPGTAQQLCNTYAGGVFSTDTFDLRRTDAPIEYREITDRILIRYLLF